MSKAVFRVFVTGLLFLVTFTSGLRAQTFPLEERLFILSKTYAAIPLYFAHWEDAAIKPQQLDSVYKEFLSRAVKTEDRKDFALLMQEFIALLNNSHSWYSDNQFYSQTKPVGFTWRNLEGQWVVTDCFLDGVKAGDVILKINGKPVDDYYKELSKYISSSGDRLRKGNFIFILPFFLPDQYSLEFKNEKDKTIQIQVDRGKIKPKDRDFKTEGRWIKENSIAYIKAPSFEDPRLENEAIEYVKNFKSARILIVDVRGNGGGTTPSRLIEGLMNKPYRWQAESSPLNISLFRFYVEIVPKWLKEYREGYKQEPPDSWKALLAFQDYFKNSQLLWKSDYTKPESTIYTGKLVILTDGSTASAAEDLVMPFKDNGGAVIIGEPTYGSTGQPYMHDFGDGIRIGIGTKRVYMPDGSKFEGVGIQPDIEVKVTREDLYKDRDRVLEKAVEVVKK